MIKHKIDVLVSGRDSQKVSVELKALSPNYLGTTMLTCKNTELIISATGENNELNTLSESYVELLESTDVTLKNFDYINKEATICKGNGSCRIAGSKIQNFKTTIVETSDGDLEIRN
jgi:hypothetical protein